jgi:hypothetical protein
VAPKSPDLNPIDNLWRIVKRQIRVTLRCSSHELEEEIQRVWDSIPRQQINELVLSFPGRVQKMLESGGEDCENEK